MVSSSLSYRRISYIVSLVILSAWIPLHSAPDSTSYYAQRIEALHNQYTKYFDHIRDAYTGYTTPYTQLSYDLSQEMQHVIHDMCNDICSQLGEKPCRMSLITFGSLARYEAGFFTDLEMGILVTTKTPETVHYVRCLIQKLAEQLHNIHKHLGKKIIYFDSADHTPPFTPPDSQLQNTSGTRLLIATPHELAEYLDLFYITKCKNITHQNQQKAHKDAILRQYHLYPHYARVKPYIDEIYTPLRDQEEYLVTNIVNLSRNVSHVWGDKDVSNMYHACASLMLHKYEYGTSLRKIHAHNMLSTDIEKHPYIQYLQTLPHTIDIKRNLYRFAEECISNLCLYANIKENNSIAALHQLYHTGWINKACHDDLTAYMDYMIGLRLRQQRYLQRQAHNIIRDRAPILPPDISHKIDTIYLDILRTTYACVQKFTEGNTSAFLTWKSFY